MNVNNKKPSIITCDQDLKQKIKTEILKVNPLSARMIIHNLNSKNVECSMNDFCECITEAIKDGDILITCDSFYSAHPEAESSREIYFDITPKLYMENCNSKNFEQGVKDGDYENHHKEFKEDLFKYLDLEYNERNLKLFQYVINNTMGSYNQYIAFKELLELKF